MTTMKRTINPKIMERLVQPLTLTEQEEVSGGDLLNDLKSAWILTKCGAGFHDYNITFEHKPYSGSWILSRAVKTCKYCGHKEYEGWVVK